MSKTKSQREASRHAKKKFVVKPAVKESLGEQFLQALASEGRWAEAASLCPRVLKVGRRERGWDMRCLRSATRVQQSQQPCY